MSSLTESDSESTDDEEFMLLETTQEGYEEYLQKAMFNNGLEFEWIYGNTLKKTEKKIDKEIFIKIIRKLNESMDYVALNESSSLDIRTEYKYKGKTAMSNIRASVIGLSNIKKYCLTDSLDDLNVEFLKKNPYKDPLKPIKRFGTLQNVEYNFRINLKSELELGSETNEQVLQFKRAWSRKLKMFRYKKRYSFITKNKLFRVDVTAIKTNRYNSRTNTYEYARTFKESNILGNPETFELEIEYIGSNDSDVVRESFTPENLPIETFLTSHDKSHSLMNVMNPFMSVSDTFSFTPFTPALEIDEDVSESVFDDEPSYGFESPRYTAMEPIDVLPKHVSIDEVFLKENDFILSETNDHVYVPLIERTNYKPTQNDKQGNYYRVSVTPPLFKKFNGEKGEINQLWVPIHMVVTDQDASSQKLFGGGPPKRTPHHKKSYNELLYNDKAVKEVLKVLEPIIYDCLSYIEGTKYILDIYEKQEIFGEYASLLNADRTLFKQGASFVGPQPVSISLKDVQPTNPNSILQGYVVTEKADGIRAELFISSKSKKGYLITQKKEVFDTGTYFDGIDSSWIFDGEYITKNSKGEDIKLFMIFDVYWGSSKTTKNNKVHQLPWISKNKKDPSRSLIIHEFQQNTVLNIDDKHPQSVIRIGFKNYLEGPKKLTKKKGSEEYSNLNGIFKVCKKILDIEDKKGGFEYTIDGLILLPMYLPVKCSFEGEKIVNFGGTWYQNFKWKPPEENTIDFRVTYEKGHKVYTTTMKDESGKDKIVSYQKLFVSVGYNEKDDDSIDFNQKQALNLPKGKRNNILFKADEGYHITNIVCTNKKVICLKDKLEIKDNDIVEMRYEPSENGFKWVPLRIRSDKVRPQYFKTANSIWDTIQNPVTKDLIMGKLDLKDHPYEEEGSEAYYVNNKDYDNSKPIRSLHNYIKSVLIHNVCSSPEFKDSITIADLSCGRGGDNGKYLAVDNNVEFLLGLDLSSNVNEAASRYYYDTHFRDKYKEKPKALFLQYDTSKSILNKEGCLGDTCETYLDILLGSDKTYNKDMKQIHKKYNGLLRNKFNVVSSQFTLHYYFKDEETLRGYLQNLSDMCQKDGYFIGTCYDGMKLFQTFKDQESDHITMEDDAGVTVYDIHKKFDGSDGSFDFNKDDISNMFGNKIDVYMSSIGQYIEEYLVNFEFLIHLMEEYGFTLQNPKMKKNSFIKGPIGNFEEIIDNLDTVKEDKSFKKHYRDSLEVSRVAGYRKLSGLNNWFIFKKTN